MKNNPSPQKAINELGDISPIVRRNNNEDKTPKTSDGHSLKEDRGSNICEYENEHKKFYDFFGSIDCDLCMIKFQPKKEGEKYGLYDSFWPNIFFYFFSIVFMLAFGIFIVEKLSNFPEQTVIDSYCESNGGTIGFVVCFDSPISPYNSPECGTFCYYNDGTKKSYETLEEELKSMGDLT